MSKSETPNQLSNPQLKRQSRGVKRARELLDVATALFIRKGIEETTIDDIVAHAGAAKGTFYHHYSSKADLLLAIRTAHLEDFDSYVEHELQKQASNDPLARLETWVRAACEAYALMVDRQDIAFSGAGFRWTPRNMKHMEALVVVLEQGNEQNCWHIQDVYTVAIFIEKGILGVMDDLILANKSLKHANQNVIEMVRGILGL